jgi:hypothetical protein
MPSADSTVIQKEKCYLGHESLEAQDSVDCLSSKELLKRYILCDIGESIQQLEN